MDANSSDTDWKMIGWCVGAFFVGTLVGAILGGPIVQKWKNKKGSKKPETTPPTKP